MTLALIKSPLDDKFAQRAATARDEILADIGDLSGYELFFNRILVAIFERPEKTAGGIILSQQTLKEDQYQGVVGLVLKVGPTAFKDDDKNNFHGQSVKAGDWIQYRPSDTEKTKVNGKMCRLLEDAHVRARVSHPEQVW